MMLFDYIATYLERLLSQENYSGIFRHIQGHSIIFSHIQIHIKVY